MKSIVSVAAFATLAVGATTGAAARDVQVRAIRDVLDCQKVADAGARLTCFEQAATALAKATGEGDVVVLDREAVSKTRRELFGFSVSTADLFGKREEGAGKAAAADDLDEITSTIQAVSRNADGGYVLQLAQGGRWEQISLGSFGRAPRPGMTVVVKKAAFGSFKMKIGDAPAIKVRRIG